MNNFGFSPLSKENPKESYTEEIHNLVTFEPSGERRKANPHNFNNKVIESSIEASDFNISALLNNIVKHFETKRKQNLLKKVFQGWIKSYYEASIRSKGKIILLNYIAIEIEIKRKHNFLLVRKCFQELVWICLRKHNFLEGKIEFSSPIPEKIENRFTLCLNHQNFQEDTNDYVNFIIKLY